MIDLHTHTYLCGHAHGLPEEYILSAIEHGIKVYGFSDHAPLPEDMRDGITMSPDETESYIEMVLSLAEKHRNHLEILLGFEVDYPQHASFNTKYYSDDRIDYLIGSCHFIGDWPIDMPERLHEYELRGINNIVEEYLKNIMEMVKSGKYNIIGHFDLFKKFGHRPNKCFSDIIRDIAIEAKKNDVAIELNTSGIRKPVREIYPSTDIIEIFADVKAPFTLGSDSHSPNEVGMDFQTASSLFKEYGITKLSVFRKRKRVEINI